MAEEKRSQVTAADVARLAGVSQSAVSRAFTPGASVSEATRFKILKVAEDVGYRPNALARSLTTKRTHLIGVAMGRLENPFFAAALEALTLELAQVGLRLLLFSAHPETPMDEVFQYRLEALIMLSVPLSPRVESECRSGQVPVIMFNRTHPDTSVSSVTGDNLEGGRALAAFLLAGEHKRVAFMSGLEESTASSDREAGFMSFLREKRHPLFKREQADFTSAGAARAMRRLLLAAERPDAVFCANDQMALTAIQVAQAEFGLEVGREISIVGFDDVPQANWPGAGLTTYSQPVADMVESTLEIIDGLRSDADLARQIVVSGELIIRSSARKPPAFLAGRRQPARARAGTPAG